ncbi:MAG: hypothetical protein JRJ75_16660 [Deltaproteobacteria bacterium]|nr:hypothetical protein [Deltaproteobacteria bacterium]
MSFRNRMRTSLKDLLESQGRQAPRVVRECLESGELAPEDFSLREVWEACQEYERGKRKSYWRDTHEAVSSDMFPTITGEVISAKVIDAYQTAPGIADKISTTIPSKHRTEKVAGFEAVEGPEEVPEGRDYNESDLGEKYAEITNKKFGRILSVTEEMIYFDQTQQVLNRARTIGEKAALYREKSVVQAMMDLDNNAYKPDGVATAVYSSDHGNLLTSNAFGESGMAALLKAIQNMTDENGDPILIDESNLVVVVPSDLLVQAWQMENSSKSPEGNENSVNVFKGRFKTLSSYWVSAESATTWYAGDIKRDLLFTECWPLQVFTAKPGNEREFRADIKAMFKVRYFGGAGFCDFRHSFKCTA